MSHTLMVTAGELDAQFVELLPQRETLWSVNVVNVIGVNISLALNAASINATAATIANQELSGLVH